MKLTIPEYKTLEINTIFLDYNGTIAVDGIIPASMRQRLELLGESFQLYGRHPRKCRKAVRRAATDCTDVPHRQCEGI